MNEQFTTYTAADVAEGLQDFLICIEMFLAALAHAYAFPPRVRGAAATNSLRGQTAAQHAVQWAVHCKGHWRVHLTLQ